MSSVAVKNAECDDGHYAFTTVGSDFSFEVCYPEENPKNALLDVTKTLEHMGVFDGIETAK